MSHKQCEKSEHVAGCKAPTLNGTNRQPPIAGHAAVPRGKNVLPALLQKLVGDFF